MPGNDQSLRRAQGRIIVSVCILLAILILLTGWFINRGLVAEEQRFTVSMLERWRDEVMQAGEAWAAEATFDGRNLGTRQQHNIEISFTSSQENAEDWLSAGAPGFDVRDYLIDGQAVSRTVGAVVWGAAGPRLIAVRGSFEIGSMMVDIGPPAPVLGKLPQPESGEYAIFDRNHTLLTEYPLQSRQPTVFSSFRGYPGALEGEIRPVDLPGGINGYVAPIFDADRWDVNAYLVYRTEDSYSHISAQLWFGLCAFVLAASIGILFGISAWRRVRHENAPAFRFVLFLIPLLCLHQMFGTGKQVGGAVITASNILFTLDGVCALVLTTAAVAIAVVAKRLLRRMRTETALRQATAAAAFLTPSLLYLAIFFIGPILFALTISFFDWDVVGAARDFVGFGNYLELFNDPLFWNSLWNTLFYSLHVPVAMVIALAIAVPLQRKFRGVTILRTLFFLPYITSFVAISTVWQWLYNTDFGLLNYLLGMLGIGPVNWLSDPNTAMLAIMVMSIWLQLGYMMVVFIAGLQSIPQHLYEAATLDGAGRWQQFRRITLPLLRPTIFFILVTSVINSFQVFTYVYVMTQGGPMHGTEVLVYQIYKNAWEYFRMGYASAAAWVLFILIMIVTLVQFTWFRKRIEEVQF